MNSKWNLLRSLPFRLLAYLLIVGSVPLVLSMIIYYQQTSVHSRTVVREQAQHMHERMDQLLRQELGRLQATADALLADPTVRGAGEGAPAERWQLEERFDEIATREKLELPIGVCLVTKDGQAGSCEGLPGELLQLSDRPASQEYRLIVLPPDHWEKRFGAALLVPFGNTGGADSPFLIVTEPIVTLLDEFRTNDGTIMRQILFDDQRTAFTDGEKPVTDEWMRRSPEQFPLVTDGRIVSELPVGLDGTDWTYQVELRDPNMDSTWGPFKRISIALFALTVLLSAIGSFVVTRFIMRPIRHLRTLMKRAEAGDLKAYWSNRGTQEMEELGESYNQMLFRIDELFRQVKLEEALKKEAEIEALQYQLNPHFLYNTLNTIKWVAKIHRTPQISEAVSCLVRLLQASLGKKGDFLTLKEEIGLIRDYMEIQAFRYGEQVKVVYDIDPLASVCLVPRMILQPLVENALIHGIEPSPREGIVTIKAWLERDLLFCQVEDNGIGMPPVEEEEPARGTAGARRGVREKLSGIGLRHIRQKIKLYYGPDYKMHVFGKPNEGTMIRLTLPVHRGEE